MNIRAFFFIWMMAGAVHTSLAGQDLELQTCLDSAEKNMPILRQKALMDEVLENKITSYNRNYLPVVSLNGQATYQSEVIEFVDVPPGFPNLDIPKAQYRVYADLYQPIYDAGFSGAQKEIQLAENEADLSQLHAQVYQVKKQVSQIYFQALLLQEKEGILRETLALLRSRKNALEAAVSNGAAGKNELLKLKAEILNQEKSEDDILNARLAALEILELFTGIPMAERKLVLPRVSVPDEVTTADNPELMLIESRSTSLMARNELLSAQRSPHLGAFGQAGFGLPNPYNFFDTELSSYYMIGIRASWVIWDWSKTSLDRRNLELNRMMITEQKNQKELEIRSELIQLRANELVLLRSLNRDQEMLEIRREIRELSEVQLDQGIITHSDFLEELMAEQVAAFSLNLDEVSLQQTRVMIQFETGSIE